MLLRRKLLRLTAAPLPTMTDLFALLGEPRRPDLDPERIKQTFHRLSRTEHPFDAVWDTRPLDAAVRLHEFYQRFAYLSRWTDQLRERLFQLGL